MGMPAPLKSRSRIKLPEREVAEAEGPTKPREKRTQSGLYSLVPFPELLTERDLKTPRRQND